MSAKKDKKFVPAKHRPTLPLSEARDSKRSDGIGTVYRYVQVAWCAYWKMVHKVARRRRCTLWTAHRRLQREHPFQLPDMSEGYWRIDDLLMLFLWQFEGWQMEEYDLGNLYEDCNDMTRRLFCITVQMIDSQTTLKSAFKLFPDDFRKDFVDQLWCNGQKHLLEQIVDDPLFGMDAKKELENMAWSEAYKASESQRRAALPDNVREIDNRIAKVGPSSYAVMFPYPSNEFHNVPNCLCVMADGSPIFRLEVLDPPTCSRFKLAEVKEPWWGLYAGIIDRPEPGEGEYDFPFYDFDLSEGDELDLDKLLEVIDRGCEQIETRGDRKWGKPSDTP